MIFALVNYDSSPRTIDVVSLDVSKLSDSQIKEFYGMLRFCTSVLCEMYGIKVKFDKEALNVASKLI